MDNKRERGFTLIELVIGIAIMALVGAAVFGVLSSSLRAYQYGSSDEHSFNQVRSTLSAIATELRYDAEVNAPAAGATDEKISYTKNGEAHSIELGTALEAGNVVIVTPGDRILYGNGLIQAATFIRDAAEPRRITVTVTAAQITGGVTAAITLTMVVWTGSI
ncbi:type II secretion system protein J [Anaeroselena agilis]|uniref:Prepilin-type N-terminal cleavage/methylation domain-containing protein n=1 Tax=Anaeroselena agilis TaxID=3063788 RepID=A0ABU3NYM1_9FIRM|nr:prepilin-type N-terminal cleavage/methylation domain-containing protein [Selenomonadales bacterium 4137-cl]